MSFGQATIMVAIVRVNMRIIMAFETQSRIIRPLCTGRNWGGWERKLAGFGGDGGCEDLEGLERHDSKSDYRRFKLSVNRLVVRTNKP